MIKYLKKGLAAVVLVMIIFNTFACNSRHIESNGSSSDDGDKTGVLVINNMEQTENDEGNGEQLYYDKTKELEENIRILNTVLEKKYGKSFKILALEDYEKGEPSDWTIVLKDKRVGIDTSTWKFDYNPDSDESKYMKAVLRFFTFICGEDMGMSLWQLTGDLLDGGADETRYGFVHNGSQVTYKNGSAAIYESGISQDTMYIWLTPGEY